MELIKRSAYFQTEFESRKHNQKRYDFDIKLIFRLFRFSFTVYFARNENRSLTFFNISGVGFNLICACVVFIKILRFFLLLYVLLICVNISRVSIHQPFVSPIFGCSRYTVVGTFCQRSQQRCIQHLLKHVRWNILRKQLILFAKKLFIYVFMGTKRASVEHIQFYSHR